MTIQKVFYRSPHNYDLELASDEASVKDFGPSLTVQSMAEDVDINVIMKRFGVTGRMPENLRPPMYGDFDEVFDFRSANDALRNAHESFMAMPAEVRARFGNDPQMLMDFLNVEDNRVEARKLGLLVPEAAPIVEHIQKVEIVAGKPAESAGGAPGPAK
jgi:phage internal scaffolding protein